MYLQRPVHEIKNENMSVLFLDVAESDFLPMSYSYNCNTNYVYSQQNKIKATHK